MADRGDREPERNSGEGDSGRDRRNDSYDRALQLISDQCGVESLADHVEQLIEGWDSTSILGQTNRPTVVNPLGFTEDQIRSQIFNSEWYREAFKNCPFLPEDVLPGSQLDPDAKDLAAYRALRRRLSDALHRLRARGRLVGESIRDETFWSLPSLSFVDYVSDTCGLTPPDVRRTRILPLRTTRCPEHLAARCLVLLGDPPKDDLYGRTRSQWRKILDDDYESYVTLALLMGRLADEDRDQRRVILASISSVALFFKMRRSLPQKGQANVTQVQEFLCMALQKTADVAILPEDLRCMARDLAHGVELPEAALGNLYNILDAMGAGQSAIGARTSTEIDPAAYMSATEIIRDKRFLSMNLTIRSLNGILRKHPEIRRLKPSPRRLCVHRGDFAKFVPDQHRRAEDDPSEIKQRTATVRENKRKK